MLTVAWWVRLGRGRVGAWKLALDLLEILGAVLKDF